MTDKVAISASEELKALIEESIADCRQDWEESHKIAPNSYGAGYDRGCLDSLERILDIINGSKS